jgi:CDP-glycerol glycerophosphotransferase
VFISQSEHLSNLYRRAFGYKGPIYKCGYPKNDKLLKNCPEIPADVRRHFGISGNDKIVLYAPTFRDSFEKNGEMDFSVYGIDFVRMKSAFEKKFGGTWTVMVKWHPILANYVKGRDVGLSRDYLDATQYNDMQDLIIASDAVVSDYSSCIFDAALRKIPCFTFATDFEEYKKDRGVYYEMDELPFPYAQNNDELEANILNFNQESYSDKWVAFKERTGLFESGHAALDIARKIDGFIKTGRVSWTLDS